MPIYWPIRLMDLVLCYQRSRVNAYRPTVIKLFLPDKVYAQLTLQRKQTLGRSTRHLSAFSHTAQKCLRTDRPKGRFQVQNKHDTGGYGSEIFCVLNQIIFKQTSAKYLMRQ